MIRKTWRSGWTARLGIAALAVAAIFGIGVAVSPPRTLGVVVIGDRADALATALGARAPQDATVTFVLLDRWDNLRHLPDVAELCWDLCHDRIAAQISVTQMRFGQSRKLVVFHLPSFDSDMACIARRARDEMSRLWSQAPACRERADRRLAWILPMGLGRVSW